MTFKEWDDLTVAERIASFPSRHPWPFRCMLHLYIETGVPWPAVDTVMRAMGYELVDVRLEREGFSLGAPTYASPEEPFR